MDEVHQLLPTINTVPEDTKSLPSDPSKPALTGSLGIASGHNHKHSGSDDEEGWELVYKALE